ncbi:MAG: RHS repeat-associated core domain-containing protein, partial [Phycisphaeraceae bacterium]|nr:RHS repeat-associated core domain-containing protein [Phycisphaeraceae bacterium]
HIAGSSIGDNGSWPAKRYNVLMDFDFSGTIEQDEYDAIQNNPDRAALPAGRMSDADFASGPWNPIGYDGYVYDDAADMSAVRFRWYDAKLGRWVNRDPYGYIDGSNRLLFVRNDPYGSLDPTGLLADPSDRNRTPESKLKFNIAGRACIEALEKALRLGCPQVRLLNSRGRLYITDGIHPTTKKPIRTFSSGSGFIDVNGQSDEECLEDCDKPPLCDLLRTISKGFVDPKIRIDLYITGPREKGGQFEERQTDRSLYNYSGSERGSIRWDCQKSGNITTTSGVSRSAPPFEILWHELFHMYHDVVGEHHRWGESDGEKYGWEEIRSIDGQNKLLDWYNKCTEEGRNNPLEHRDPFSHGDDTSRLKDRKRPWMP